ncbi:hypothetical protein ES703_45099 [subsurface metagenome]
MFGIQFYSQAHVASEFAGVMDYFHSSAAEDIARANQNRVTDDLSYTEGFIY